MIVLLFFFTLFVQSSFFILHTMLSQNYSCVCSWLSVRQKRERSSWRCEALNVAQQHHQSNQRSPWLRVDCLTQTFFFFYFFYLLFNQTPVAGEQIMEFSGGEGACTQPTWGLGILVQATHQEGERREEEEKICTVSLVKQQGAWMNGVQNWGYSSLIINSKIFTEHPLPKASSASSNTHCSTSAFSGYFSAVFRISCHLYNYHYYDFHSLTCT